MRNLEIIRRSETKMIKCVLKNGKEVVIDVTFFKNKTIEECVKMRYSEIEKYYINNICYNFVDEVVKNFYVIYKRVTKISLITNQLVDCQQSDILISFIKSSTDFTFNKYFKKSKMFVNDYTKTLVEYYYENRKYFFKTDNISFYDRFNNIDLECVEFSMFDCFEKIYKIDELISVSKL